jgi:DNA-binding HxlR family transcriptional regulator
MTQYDYTQLDDVIHARIRLAIMSVLITVEEAEFTYLREKVNTTDGNLSIHLKKLEEARYIHVNKRFVERKPQSSYRISEKGRKAFEKYISTLEQLVKG